MGIFQSKKNENSYNGHNSFNGNTIYRHSTTPLSNTYPKPTISTNNAVQSNANALYRDFSRLSIIPNAIPSNKNPFSSDFRRLSIIPTHSKTLPNKILPAVVDKKYEDLEHYLNIQFRLLREDMLRDFRLCLSDYSSGKSMENGKLYCNVYLIKIKHSLAGKLWYFAVPMPEAVDWKSTKCLASGSLVCLSSDRFQTFRFASVSSRIDDGDAGNVCSLVLSFENLKEPESFSIFFEIIETGAFYESYYHVFKNLKTFTASNFPFRNRLLDFQNCNQLPFNNDYEQQIERLAFQRKINDKNQNEAFRLALENKIALIQGPPGTGKSFLAGQIAHFLMKAAPGRTPLIVMCYTNHALDQFLEKTLKFTQNIIRIGGGSKNDELEPYNLRNLTQSLITRSKNDENDDYEDLLHKSRQILLNMCGKKISTIGSSNTRSLYGRVKRRTETLNNKLEECLKLIYPFKSSSMNENLDNIHFFNDIFDQKELQGNIFDEFRISAKYFKLHKWLMTETYSNRMYDNLFEFNEILTQELLRYMKLKNLRVIEDGSATQNGNKEPLKSLLVRLCVTNAKQNNSKQQQDHVKLMTFIEKHLNSNEIIFPLFLRTAIKYCKNHVITVPTKSYSLACLKLVERWKLLSIITEAVLQKSMSLFQNKTFGEFSMKTHYSIKGNPYTQKVPGTFNNEKHIKDLKELKLLQRNRDVQILECADIIGITATGAAKNFDLLKKLRPTTFIVEEAAEVLESQVVAALVPNIEHLIMIGDHFQLRPKPKVYELALTYNFDVSLFERLFRSDIPSKKCLQVQHRMRPSISSLLVPEFYDVLDNHPSVLNFEDIVGVSSNVFFLQHSERENYVDVLKSYSNSYESLFVVSFCEYLISQGHKPTSITILTTYLGQLNLIKSKMINKGCLQGVLAKTVDDYQGEENDIMVLSFVRSNSENKVGFIKTKNRVCVALSRARKGLYCIGNFKMFASQSPTWNTLLKKLEGMDSFGTYININCHKHPTKMFSIKSSNDLQKHIKSGCTEFCGMYVECEHPCDLLCHEGTHHICYTCSGGNNSSGNNRGRRRNRRRGKGSKSRTNNLNSSNTMSPFDENVFRQNLEIEPGIVIRYNLFDDDDDLYGLEFSYYDQD